MKWFSIISLIGDLIFIIGVILAIRNLNRELATVVEYVHSNYFLNTIAHVLESNKRLVESFRIRTQVPVEVTEDVAKEIVKKRKKLRPDQEVIFHQFEVKPYGFTAAWSIAEQE